MATLAESRLLAAVRIGHLLMSVLAWVELER